MRKFYFIIFGICLILPFILGLFSQFEGWNWKWIEISALLIGGLGIFGLVNEAYRIQLSYKLPLIDGPVRAWLDVIDHKVRTEISIMDVRIKNEHKSEGIEAAQQEYRKAKDWYLQLLNVISNSKEEFPDPRSHLEKYPADIEDRELLMYFSEYDELVQKYEAQKEKHDQLLQEMGQSSAIVESNAFLAPLCVSAAIFLALMKALYAPA